MKDPDIEKLDPENIYHSLKTKWVGRSLVCLDKTSSTNDVARRLIQEDAMHGTLVIAEEQTSGRGRAGRSWHSPPGKGLYCTLIFDLHKSANIQLITIVAGIAVAKTIRELYNIPAGIKWPNDILVKDKKVAGTLTEAISSQKGQIRILLGIGVNINHDAPDFPDDLKDVATSIRQIKKETVSRLSFLQSLLTQIETFCELLVSGQERVVISTWKDLALYWGEEVVVKKENEIVKGIPVDMDKDGALIIEGTGHMTRKILVGDVLKCEKSDPKRKNSSA